MAAVVIGDNLGSQPQTGRSAVLLVEIVGGVECNAGGKWSLELSSVHVKLAPLLQGLGRASTDSMSETTNRMTL